MPNYPEIYGCSASSWGRSPLDSESSIELIAIMSSALQAE